MSKQRDLIKNTLIIAFGKLSTQFVTFLLLPLYTAYLTTSEFGVVDLIMTYVILLAPILTVQLEMASFRYLVDAREDEGRKRALISNVLHMVGGGVLVFAAGFFILTRFVEIPYAGLIFGAVAAAIASGLFLQFARGSGDNKAFSIGGVVTGLFTVAGNIILIVGLGMGAQGMLLAMIGGNVAGALYLFIALKLRRYTSLTGGDKKLRHQLLRYSVPLVPNGVAWWLISAADRTIIALFLGVAANGVFAVAYKFPLIFAGLFSFFGLSWIESASMHINSPDRAKFFSQTMNASIRLFGSLGLLIIASIPFVFDLLVNTAFREAYAYIPILMIGAFLNSIVLLYSAIYIAKKMTRQVASTSIVSAIISISFTLVFVHFIGMYAAALAMVIAYLSMAIYRHYDVKKYVQIDYDKGVFILLFILYGVSLALYYINNSVGNVLNVLVVAIAATLLNKSVLKVIKDKVLDIKNRRRRQDASVGETYEDLV